MLVGENMSREYAHYHGLPFLNHELFSYIYKYSFGIANLPTSTSLTTMTMHPCKGLDKRSSA